jgi:hypothetical protein
MRLEYSYRYYWSVLVVEVATASCHGDTLDKLPVTNSQPDLRAGNRDSTRLTECYAQAGSHSTQRRDTNIALACSPRTPNGDACISLAPCEGSEALWM